MGSIKGTVIDEDIKSPIPDVRISVLGTSFEARSDAEGRFAIPDVPVGTYVLEFSCRFYRTRLQPDVVVKPKRMTDLQVGLLLDDAAQDEREVTVTASYFPASVEQPGSASSFSYEEIRRAAGAAGDVSRIISGLPSIARTNDMVNNLVVRGGSPAENAFYVDNIEVPNINHYPTLGSASGAIGLLNVDFIRDVSFASGGFSPIYGNRLSSVMEVDFREGNRQELDFQVDLSMMGLGAIAEGPLGGAKGSWMLSARRSYVDLLIRLLGSGVPVTWSDYQGKVSLDLSPRHKLSLIGVGGVDDSGTEKADALKDGESFFGGLDTSEYTAGLNWLAMWGARGYSRTSLSRTSMKYKFDSFHAESGDLFRKGTDLEQTWTLRNVNVLRLDEKNSLNFGFEAGHSTADYDEFISQFTDVLGRTVPQADRNLRMSAGLAAVFAEHGWTPAPWLSLRVGFRSDYHSYNRKTDLSPRGSLAFRLSPRTTLDLSAGIFSQTLPLPLLLQNGTFRALRNPRAVHYILGIRRLLTDSTRLTVEVYDKEYSRLPLDPSQPSLFVFDESFTEGFFAGHERLLDSGRARSVGVEFMVQKKLAERIYGLVSGSYSRSRYQGWDGVWRNRVYDNRYILAMEGGYRLNKGWEFSLKWNCAGGAPYTPFDMTASAAVNSGIFDTTRINGRRLPAYHSLNLRADRRISFRGSNLIIYLSAWNIFNHKNVAASFWNTIERAPGLVKQWGILPVLGVEFEF